MIELISKNSFYYKTCLVMITICTLFLCLVTRVDGFIMLNGFHTDELNYFFKIFTFFGDGILSLALFLIIVLFFKKHRNFAFVLLLAYSSSGLFAQILKNLITSPRPRMYFLEHNYKFYLDTFANSGLGHNSFPSGHTTSAFALATIFSTYLRRKYISIITLSAALLVGYSRIYLAQHFLIDVLAGAIIGILFGTFSILWIERILFKINKRRNKIYKPRLSWGNSFPDSSVTNQ